jgi:hypothetical protein
MKQLTLIILLIFGFKINAMQIFPPTDDCTSLIVKSSSNKNGIVKNTNGEIVTNKETMSIEIDPCKNTVIIELNNKKHDLVLYRIGESGTIHAATLNGKQIIEINIDSNTNEVRTTFEDLIFITYMDRKIINSRPIAIEE